MKYCIGCKHWNYEPGREGYHYSEYTHDSGESCVIECLKKHWELDTENDTREQFANYLEMAEKCPDFEERSADPTPAEQK